MRGALKIAAVDAGVGPFGERFESRLKVAGVDVAAKRGSHLCLLEDGEPGELRVTFYKPGPIDKVAKALRACRPDVVAIDAPANPRHDLLAATSPLRERITWLKAGVHQRSRVCDALLVKRGLYLYSVPSSTETQPEWMQAGFELFRILDEQGFTRFKPSDTRFHGAITEELEQRSLIETFPDAAFCVLLGHRPPPKRAPAGMKARIEALENQGIGTSAQLWARDGDEIDACAAAVVARAAAQQRAQWLGEASEGVLVLPGHELKDSYKRESGDGPRRERLP